MGIGERNYVKNDLKGIECQQRILSYMPCLSIGLLIVLVADNPTISPMRV